MGQGASPESLHRCSCRWPNCHPLFATLQLREAGSVIPVLETAAQPRRYCARRMVVVALSSSGREVEVKCEVWLDRRAIGTASPVAPLTAHPAAHRNCNQRCAGQPTKSLCHITPK